MKRLAYSRKFLGLALIATVILVSFTAYAPRVHAIILPPLPTWVNDDTYSQIGWMDAKRVGWFYSAGNLYLTVQYQTNIPNSPDNEFFGLFYLDTDQNPTTGDSGTGGSDYSIMFGYTGDGSPGEVSGTMLDRWDSGSARWVYVKYLADPVASPGGDTVQVAVSLADIGSPTTPINILCLSEPDRIDMIETKYSYTTGKAHAITVDGNSADWGTPTPVIADPPGDASPGWADATNFYTTDNAGKLYLRMDLAATPPALHPEDNSEFSHTLFIYFDTDHDPSTGYSFFGIGAEYYLGVTVYTDHTSRSSPSFLQHWSGTSWTTVSSPTTETALGTCFETSLLLSNIGDPTKMDIYILNLLVQTSDYVPNSGYFIASSLPHRQLSEVSSQILSASANKAYFIYADPYRMVNPNDWSMGFAAYDATTAGLLYGLCTNTQNICYDSDPSIVVTKISSGNPFNYGKVLLSSKSIVVMGGPIPNWAVDYYERTGQTPLKFNYDWANPGFVTQAGTTVASIPSSTDMKHNDLFVVEAFQDTNGNYVLVIYGLGWKGTFAGGVYFKEVIKPNLTSYTNSFYTFRWTDAGGMDGVPQASEITPVAIV